MAGREREMVGEGKKELGESQRREAWYLRRDRRARDVTASGFPIWEVRRLVARFFNEVRHRAMYEACLGVTTTEHSRFLTSITAGHHPTSAISAPSHTDFPQPWGTAVWSLTVMAHTGLFPSYLAPSIVISPSPCNACPATCCYADVWPCTP